MDWSEETELSDKVHTGRKGSVSESSDEHQVSSSSSKESSKETKEVKEKKKKDKTREKKNKSKYKKTASVSNFIGNIKKQKTTKTEDNVEGDDEEEVKEINKSDDEEKDEAEEDAEKEIKHEKENNNNKEKEVKESKEKENKEKESKENKEKESKEKENKEKENKEKEIKEKDNNNNNKEKESKENKEKENKEKEKEIEETEKKKSSKTSTTTQPKKSKVSKYFNSLITPKKESSSGGTTTKESAYRSLRNKITPSQSLSTRQYRSKANTDSSDNRPIDDINLKQINDNNNNKRSTTKSERGKTTEKMLIESADIPRDNSMDNFRDQEYLRRRSVADERDLQINPVNFEEFGPNANINTIFKSNSSTNISSSGGGSSLSPSSGSNSNMNQKMKKTIPQLRSSLFLPGQSKKIIPKINLLDKLNLSEVLEEIDVKLFPHFLTCSYPSFLDLSPLSFNIKSAEFLALLNDVYKVINLSQNSLSELKHLKNLTKLKILQVDDNQLNEISLEGLSNLKYLSLENNLLSHLPSFDDLNNLLYLNLRGNKLTGGYSEIAKLTNLRVLDISNCSIDQSLDDFKDEILPALINLKKLEYFCFAENQIAYSNPEIKYIIVSKLPQLKMYDYQEITPETREIAPSVVEKGIQILNQLSGNKREELRLAAEQDSPYHKKEEIAKVIIELKETFDISKLQQSISIQILSYLNDDDLYSSSLVCKYWNRVCKTIRDNRNAKILKSYTVILPCHFSSPSLINIIRNIEILAPFSISIIPINHYDEEMLIREKLIFFIIDKHQANDVYSHLYDQLTNRLFRSQNHATLPYKNIRYSIMEIDKDSMAYGIDQLLRTMGATKIVPSSKYSPQSLEERVGDWLKLIPQRLKSEFCIN